MTHPAAQPQLVTLGEAWKVSRGKLMDACHAARSVYQAKKFKEARAIFRGLAMLDPENVQAHLGLGLSAAADQDLPAAIAAVERAVTVLRVGQAPQAKLAEAQALLASLLFKAGRKKEAVELGNNALTTAPDAEWATGFQTAVADAGTKLARKGGVASDDDTVLREALQDRLAQAAAGTRSLAWALGYQDKDLMELHDNATALLQSNQPAKAKRVFEGLVALDATIPLFHLGLGTVNAILGETAAARAAFDAAVDVAKGVPGGTDLLAGALARRAQFLVQAGDAAAAKTDANALLKLSRGAVAPEDWAAAENVLRLASSPAPAPTAPLTTPVKPATGPAAMPRGPPVAAKK